MKDYFFLQYKMTNRLMKEIGMSPLLGYVLGIAAFAFGAGYLFQKTVYASYLLVFLCLSFQLKLSEKRRSDFLQTTFGEAKKRRIRLLENGMVSIPFVVILLITHHFVEAGMVLVASAFLAVFTFETTGNFTIPTPFSKHLFEFTVGFRNTFYMCPVAYTLVGVAAFTENVNLGIFAMLLVYLVSLSYYTKPENEFYVWVHSDTTKRFVFKKLGMATRNGLILTLPAVVGLLVLFPADFQMILLFYGLGLAFLWLIVVAKYAAYPREMSLPEAIMIAMCGYLPPMLILFIPFFYFRAISKLKLILNDNN